MSDDLIERLRGYGDGNNDLMDAAADRIEKLEEEIGVLFAANVRLNSRADLDSDGYVDRIEKLEAALRDIASGRYSGIVLTSVPPQDPAINRAKQALEGKDD